MDDETPQVCSNQECRHYDKDTQDMSNCGEFRLPQLCRGFRPLTSPPLSTVQQKPSRAQELVDAHWDNYVGPMLAACGVAADLLPMLEFMYKSSGAHFYKHAMEDQQELARKAMMQSEIERAIKANPPAGV